MRLRRKRFRAPLPPGRGAHEKTHGKHARGRARKKTGHADPGRPAAAVRLFRLRKRGLQAVLSREQVERAPRAKRRGRVGRRNTAPHRKRPPGSLRALGKAAHARPKVAERIFCRAEELENGARGHPPFRRVRRLPGGERAAFDGRKISSQSGQGARQHGKRLQPELFRLSARKTAHRRP